MINRNGNNYRSCFECLFVEESHWGQVVHLISFIELVHINASKNTVFTKIKQKFSVSLKALLIESADTAIHVHVRFIVAVKFE